MISLRTTGSHSRRYININASFSFLSLFLYVGKLKELNLTNIKYEITVILSIVIIKIVYDFQKLQYEVLNRLFSIPHDMHKSQVTCCQFDRFKIKLCLQMFHHSMLLCNIN